ncbi:hypothetical protein F4808DRAFT_444991 [Astrocystis sublimbata]|nr:hypothetical protein F4808DRAFT_444991 [Astrocystis sublimbata]
MVGVPGKYKGCNTCRTRRVKCDNTRPFCKKCIDYGRECAGYERETVFIVGTQNDRGRVGSHPPRNAQSSRAAQSEVSTQHTAGHSYIAAEPLRAAWEENVSLQSGPKSQVMRIVARYADLDSAIEVDDMSPEGHGASLSWAGSRALDVAPTFREEVFTMKSCCFVSLPEDTDDSTPTLDGRVCLFLYQQNSSTVYTKEPTLADAIRELGPAAYRAFPEHHFFARVYRPNAVWAALLNRQPTFLCNPEWTVVPWEHYPRTSLDFLLDIVVLLPSIFSRTDDIIQQNATPEHQLEIKDLLVNCLNIEAQFDIWLSAVQQMTSTYSAPYWVADRAARIPFNEPLSFASPLLCLMHVYYWAVLIAFHQCIYTILKAVEEPEDEGTADVLPLGLDPQRYQPAETRKLAELVCRSLDFALHTTAQPDSLLAPVWVVRDFYSRMKFFGLCELEGLWVDDFTERLGDHSRRLNNWLEEKRWIGIRQFG